MRIVVALVVFYLAMIPFIRKLQRDDDSEDGLPPKQAFGLWVLSPLTLSIWVGVQLWKRVPALLFPTPQAAKVRDRLRRSAEQAEKEQQ